MYIVKLNKGSGEAHDISQTDHWNSGNLVEGENGHTFNDM